jgi:hypothetical protein
MGRALHWYEGRDYVSVEGAVVGRVLDNETQSILGMMAGQPTVTATSFAATMEWHDHSSEMDAFIERSFDAWLYFDNNGPREVGFAIPLEKLSTQDVAPHVVGDFGQGLAADTRDDDLLLRFRYYAADAEQANLYMTGLGWLQHILPVREELLSGTTEALELGRLIGLGGNQFKLDPDMPAEYGLSRASRILAAYLLIEPEDLERWSTERAGTRRDELPSGWLSGRVDLTPVARWEFAAADPRKSFQIRLGRLPDGCDHGSWYVASTEPRGKSLAFHTEREARQGYHDEALRLQRLNGPGRWQQLIPD